MGNSFHMSPCESVMLEMRREMQAAEDGSVASRLRLAYLGEERHFSGSLSQLLSEKLAGIAIGVDDLRSALCREFQIDPGLVELAVLDLVAFVCRDPANRGFHIPFLFQKGFHALQVYRVAASLWRRGAKVDAMTLSNLCAEKLGVDIHPAACIGKSIFLDHADGVVIGETAVIGNDVTVLHGVTLGGNGKQRGDRHPKIGDGVLIGANATLLGNIVIGDCAQIGAGAVVLASVPAHHIAVGVPAKVRPISKLGDMPAVALEHSIPAEIRSDYEI